MSGLVFSNLELKNQAEQFVLRANEAGWVQLYQNDVDPNSDSVLTDFLRCDFGGYLPVALTGLVAAPIKLHSGLYRATSALLAFTPLVDDVQEAMGYFVQIGPNVACAQKFAFPIPIQADVPILFPLLADFRQAAG